MTDAGLRAELKKYLSQHYRNESPEETQYIYDCDLGEINLGEMEPGFSETVVALAHKKYRRQSDFCARAGLSRQLFTMMKTNPDYLPYKHNAFACVVALELELPDAEALLRRGSYAFSKSSLMDLIVRFFISKRIYDIDRINEVLDDYGQHTLGSI